jgi:hypothetical protein
MYAVAYESMDDARADESKDGLGRAKQDARADESMDGLGRAEQEPEPSSSIFFRQRCIRPAME